MNVKNKILGGSLLVAGTSIGAGMLALPITTGAAGFKSAMFLFAACFAFMMYNLFLLVEVNLVTRIEGANIISISKKHLGRLGEGIAGFSLVFILYAASVAYITASTSLLDDLLQALLKQTLSTYWGMGLFVGGFAGIVYAGIHWIDRINRLLMIGLIASYLLLIVVVAPHIRLEHLVSTGHGHGYLWAAIPVVVTSFTSHIIAPSLCEYFHRETKPLKRALWIGSLIPLAVYVVWEIFLIGVLPAEGRYSLLTIAQSPQPVAGLVNALDDYLHVGGVALNVGAFSFFALATSFLGVALSLADFLADGLKINKHTRKGRSQLVGLTFIPPLLFAFLFPNAFVLAIGYVGAFIVVLYGILPSFMVWRVRYIEKLNSPLRVPGGKLTLVAVPLLGVGVIGIQLLTTLGYLQVA